MKSNLVQKFSESQIENIINKIVPVVANEEEQEFFRAVLHLWLPVYKSSAEATVFLIKLLNLNKTN